jgi:HPr kinase/phosphorylase
VKPVQIHASCVAIKGKGVLILGESGAGKSDLALRLMDDGARLVADDRTELMIERGRLYARAPKSIAGLIEVRGLGIVAQPFARKAVVALVVKLDAAPERMPKPAVYTPPEPLQLAKKPPFLLLDGRLPSAPAKIRLALAAFTKGLRREDFNPT